MSSDLAFDVVDLPLPTLDTLCEDDWMIKEPSFDFTSEDFTWSGDLCVPVSVGALDESPNSPQSQGDFSGSDALSPSASSACAFDSDLDMPDFHGLNCVGDPVLDIKPEPVDDVDDFDFFPSGVKLEHKTTKPPSRKRSSASRSDSLCFTKDELLELTADTLDEVAANIKHQRPLTAGEQRQLKRQKRLIKNRESAQLSRMRKKVYIDELETKVRTLTQRNSEASRQLENQRRTIARLTDELDKLQALVRTHPQLAAQYSAAIRQPVPDEASLLTSAPTDVGEVPDPTIQQVLSECASTARAKVAAGRQHAAKRKCSR
eukprot:TRINITY_DN6652_c0_g1_i5.p1 TRINITY_DN6652_c0_g1~~TRINITY_DN6652_c0_g1_i5.p1  ORF type:complete len:318 (-),score=54.00 TRINITY_DN6652_c0_g1_i5:319-1272(-)